MKKDDEWKTIIRASSKEEFLEKLHKLDDNEVEPQDHKETQKQGATATKVAIAVAVIGLAAFLYSIS